jgi:hypothetical protein
MARLGAARAAAQQSLCRPHGLRAVPVREESDDRQARSPRGLAVRVDRQRHAGAGDCRAGAVGPSARAARCERRLGPYAGERRIRAFRLACLRGVRLQDGREWHEGERRKRRLSLRLRDESWGGKSACSNTLTVPIQLAEELIIEPMLKRLSPAVTDAAAAAAAAAAVKHVKGGRKRATAARRVTPELARSNAKIADLERLIAAGALSAVEAGPALERARALRDAAERDAKDGNSVVDMTKLAEEFKGWTGALRSALGGADISQAREALRQMGGPINLRVHTERGERAGCGRIRPWTGRGSRDAAPAAAAGQDRRSKWSIASSLADVPPTRLSPIPRQVGKQGTDDCSGGHIAQDCDAPALSIGVYLENARRSMEGDTAPDDQPERSRVSQAAATEGQDRKSKLRAREEIRDQIGTGCETNSDDARDQMGRDGENDTSGQGNEAVDDEQRA